MTLFPCDPLVLSSSYLLLWLDYEFYHSSITCCSLVSRQLPVKLVLQLVLTHAFWVPYIWNLLTCLCREMIDFNATALKSFDDGASYLEAFVKQYRFSISCAGRLLFWLGFLEFSLPMLFQTWLLCSIPNCMCKFVEVRQPHLELTVQHEFT
jgi:hypothetical protein